MINKFVMSMQSPRYTPNKLPIPEGIKCWVLEDRGAVSNLPWSMEWVIFEFTNLDDLVETAMEFTNNCQDKRRYVYGWNAHNRYCNWNDFDEPKYRCDKLGIWTVLASFSEEKRLFSLDATHIDRVITWKALSFNDIDRIHQELKRTTERFSPQLTPIKLGDYSKVVMGIGARNFLWGYEEPIQKYSEDSEKEYCMRRDKYLAHYRDRSHRVTKHTNRCFSRGTHHNEFGCQLTVDDFGD